MKSFTRLSLFIGMFLLLIVLVSGSIQVLTAEDHTSLSPTSPLIEAINAGLERDQEEPGQLTPLGATPCIGGMAGSYPCQNVDLLSFMPLGTIGGGNGSGNWGWTDPGSGREFAIMGRSNGTAFVEITNPTAPVYLGNLPSHTGSSSWRELKTYSNYVYIVADNNGAHGMQVFDLNQLLTVPSPPVTFSESAHYNGVTEGHTITTNEDTGYAFIFGSNTCSGGLHFVDLQNPLSPVGAGCYSDDGYTHDGQCVVYNGPDAAHQGKEICFAYNADTLTIVDVTNKNAPVELSRTGYAGEGYTHQGWLTDDQEYLVMDDELDEQQFGHNTRTYMWDVGDLDDPVMMDYFQSTTPAIDHNQFMLGDHVFQANYRAGMRILDGSNIASAELTEVGYFDIYPANNNASFNGAWHVYPYFPSGVVIVSGIGEGLFMLRPMGVQAEDTVLEVCQNDSDGIEVDVTELFGVGGGVLLSLEGLPSGATADIVPNPVVAPGTSQLTITTTNATAGSHPLTLSGSSGTITYTQALTLNVLVGSLAAPTLVAPIDGAVDQPLQPTFTWGAVPNALSYDLQVAADPAFSTIVLSETGITNQDYTPTISLDLETTYYWRVKAHGGCATSDFSAPFSFTTESLPAPTLYYYLPFVVAD